MTSMTHTTSFRVVVHGGGPVGCLTAMLWRAYTDDVTIVERRSDARRRCCGSNDAASRGRSINLVLTSRGLYALQQVGLREAVLQLTVPIEGRLVHSPTQGNIATTAAAAAAAGTAATDKNDKDTSPPTRHEHVEEEVTMQRYGLHAREVNYSISRNELNKLLLSAAEARGVRVLFDHELVDVDVTAMTATYRVHNGDVRDVCAETTTVQLRADLFVGADGVNSVTRRCMLAQCRRAATAASDVHSGDDEEVAAALTEVLEPLGVSYKELHFPPRRADAAYPARLPPCSSNSSSGDETKKCEDEGDSNKAMVYSMNCHGLHLWPHGVHFLMALADVGNTFTGTMYLPNRTAKLPTTSSCNVDSDINNDNNDDDDDDAAVWRALPTFDELERDAAALQRHIATYYPALPRYVPDWAAQLQQRRASPLYTLHCPTWHYAHTVVLLGDAAHAVTPFFGQGLNLGFESAMLLDRFVRRSGALTVCQDSGNNSSSGTEMRAQRLAAALSAYEAHHHASADAIARMAKANFVDMAQHTTQDEWRQLRALEQWVEARCANTYRSRYYLVTQTLTPYRVAELAGPVLERCVRALMQLYTTRVRAARTAMASNGNNSNRSSSSSCEAMPRYEDVLTHEDVCAAIATYVTPFACEHNLHFADPAYDGFYPSPTCDTADNHDSMAVA